jgi:hypothetical protein
MNKKTFMLVLAMSIVTFPAVFAAQFITGFVHSASDGTSPNDRIISLWNPSTGSDSINSTIGPNGPSFTDNIYLIDCEELNTSCNVGDVLFLQLLNDSSGYIGLTVVNVTVTGAGFDVAPNISMNAPPNITNVTVDDVINSPAEEIDLIPANTSTAYCWAIVEDYQGLANIANLSAQLYSNLSSFGGTDDNNNHYTNTSCFRNDSFGNENQTFINCSFRLQYYANAGNWSCTINATDTYTARSNQSDTVVVNTLLAVGVNDTLTFGNVSAGMVSIESSIQVINYGNVQINLSLSGYGNATDDNNSMVCDTGNITLEHMKFNLSQSHGGFMNITTANLLYKNLSNTTLIEPFRLTQRQNDASNDAWNNTFWRIFVPGGVGTDCQGHIIIGATQQ